MACETCDEQIKGKCVDQINSDCIYTDKELPNSGVPKDTLLTTALLRLDTYIEELKTTLTRVVRFFNIGGGAGVYKGVNNQGEHELRTLTSTNNSVTITEGENTINLSVEVDAPVEVVQATEERAGIAEIATQLEVSEGTDDQRFVTPYKLQIELDGRENDYYIEGVGNEVRFYQNSILQSTAEIPIPDGIVVTDFTLNGTSLEITLSDGTTFTEDLAGLVDFQQVQSDITEEDSSSPAFIQNRNPSKTVFANYSLTPNDNNYVIVIDSGAPVVITVPNNLPNNHTTGFIQKGTGLVTIANTNIVPEGLANTIKGRGHQAFVEKIEGTTFLFGNLNKV